MVEWLTNGLATQKSAQSTLTRQSFANNLEQVANLLYAQANSAPILSETGNE